jgi:type II secretion system protein D
MRPPRSSCWQTAIFALGVILSAAAAQGEGKGVSAQAFRPKNISLDAAATQLQEALAQRNLSAEVLVEAKGQTVVVRGPASELREATRLWLTIDKAPPHKPEILLTAGPLQPASDEEEAGDDATQPFTLQHISSRSLEATLLRTWKQMNFQPEGKDGIVSARLPGAERAVIAIDHRRQAVRLSGDEKLVREWRKVVGALDSKPPGDDATTALVPIRKADPAQIKQAVRLLELAQQRAASGKKPLFVAQEQPAEDAPVPGDDEEKKPAEEMTEEPERRPPGGRGVRIFINEATGQVILIGPAEEVERIKKLIQDLEQSVGRPYIEILQLKHISDRAVSDLIAQIYDQVFGSRTGRVTITPLIKPNALLLIGPQEGVEAVKELVKQLDQPVPPTSQLRVFPLKHISVKEAEATVRTFFVDRAPETEPRAGLGTKVNVVGELRSNSLIIQASNRDLAEVAELLRRIDVGETPNVGEVRVFRLRNSLAEDLAPVIQKAITGAVTKEEGSETQGDDSSIPKTTPPTSLRILQIDGTTRKIIESGILTDVRITADPRANSLIVRGPSSSMNLIATLIEQLDQLPGQSASIKVFTLLNGDAQTLLNMLQQLFGQATNNQGGQNVLNQLSVSGENTLVPLRFAIDARTNSVIATGAGADLEVVERILLRLDESDVRRRKTTVYRLRNAPAADVSQAINQFLTNQRQLATIGQGITSSVEQLEREVVVVPEPVSNSLLVSATPRYYEEIKKIVEDLDRRPPMVVIQCVIAEVTLNSTDEFGVELGLQDSLLYDRGIPGIGFNFNNTAPLGNNSTKTRQELAGQGLVNLGLGRTNSTLGYGGFILSASNDSVSLLLRALQQSSRLQVLSRPQVQTLDNQVGFVQVGARVPYVTSSNQTQFGIQNAITFQNVGILLQVTPRTSPDGLIVMQIAAEKSQLSSDAEGVPTFISSSGQIIRSPQIFTDTAQTVVSAQSGQTVILGGLITKNRSQETRRTPYLSDIPVLGRLFRYDIETNKRTELLIIMTPSIVRTEEDVDRLNARETERMSWCLADVANVHGELPWAKGTGPFNRKPSAMIFPDENPTGREPIAPPAGAPESRFDPVERDPTPDGVFEQQPR